MIYTSQYQREAATKLHMSQQPNVQQKGRQELQGEVSELISRRSLSYLQFDSLARQFDGAKS